MFLSLISALLLATMSVLILSFLNQTSSKPATSILLDQSKELNSVDDFVDKPTQVGIENSENSSTSINQQSEVTVNTFRNLWPNTSKQVSSQAITFSGWLGEINSIGVADTVIKLSSPYKNLYYSTTTDANGNFCLRE